MKLKGALLLAVGAASLGCAAVLAVPSPIARPVYSVPQLQAGLTLRHNVWGGRTVWVRAVAVLGYDLGGMHDTVLLFDHATATQSAGFSVAVKPPNLTFTLLSQQAAIARAVPWLRWIYGERPAVYRVRFFQPTWCASCPVGQLE